MRFLADMGVSIRVVDWLRVQGHDAVHLAEESLQCLPNGGIFAKAVQERRLVLTFDLDFGEIIALSKGTATAVIVFRLRNARARHVIDRLARVLESSHTLLMEPCVCVVEETRHRVRRFPDRT